jgi:ribonuclease BN (tRNA processing enzyme)
MLARGEDVQAADGSTLEAAWFRGGERAAISVLISGDTESKPPAWVADVSPTVLIHEATFLDEQQAKAEEHQHSTATGAAASARAVGASVLALTHYSNRIKSSNKVQGEAEKVADGMPVVALNDNDRLVVDDGGGVDHLVWTKEGWTLASIAPNR